MTWGLKESKLKKHCPHHLCVRARYSCKYASLTCTVLKSCMISTSEFEHMSCLAVHGAQT